MARIAVIGATGQLGSEILKQAVDAHQVTAVVRSPAKLPMSAEGMTVRQLELASAPVASITAALAGHDAVVNAAGHVQDGQRFVDLIGKLVDALEALPTGERPVCWFLAGAAALDIGDSRRRGVDLPVVKSRYWAHGSNHDRLARSTLDWRLLCPGPLVAEPMLDPATLRVSVDRLPVDVAPWVAGLPKALLTVAFARLVPQMIVPYSNAARFMLDHLSTNDAVSRHRVGLALPVGQRGKKESWSGKTD